MLSAEYDPNQASLTGQLPALIAGFCCDALFCFDPSTLCRRTAKCAFRRTAAAAFLTNNRETRNVTEHVHGACRRKGAREWVIRSIPHTHTLACGPGFHLNANWLLCYIIAGAAERLNKLRLSRPSSGDRQQSPPRTCNRCREIQFNDVVKNKFFVNMMNPRPSTSPVRPALRQRPHHHALAAKRKHIFCKSQVQNFFLRRGFSLAQGFEFCRHHRDGCEFW